MSHQRMEIRTTNVVTLREIFADGFTVDCHNWWRLGWNHSSSNGSGNLRFITMIVRTVLTSASHIKFAIRMNEQTVVAESAIRKCPANA